MISEAATAISKRPEAALVCYGYVPIPLSLVGAELPRPDFSSFARSGVMVEVDGEREKVLARGARCVSFSSAGDEVSQ
jgi:hypothetical protein